MFAAVDGKDEEAVKKMAVIGQEGDKTVGDLSSDEKRSYFLNKVSLAPKSNHEGNADCEMFRQFLSSNSTSLARLDLSPLQPALVFLGVDERSAPDSAKSMPLSKPTDSSTLESHSPHGTPYWALDISKLSELKEKIMKEKEGREFMELRAGDKVIPNDEASIGAEARSLVDWNTRNKVSLELSRYVFNLLRVVADFSGTFSSSVRVALDL